MPKTLRFSATAVEELENPRPHYRVEVRGSVASMLGSRDPTAGLLPDEIVLTVRLSTDVGSDLATIKQAAGRRALTLFEALIETHGGDAEIEPRPAALPTNANGADVNA